MVPFRASFLGFMGGEIFFTEIYFLRPLALRADEIGKSEGSFLKKFRPNDENL
jgi:hypothetical protein